MKKPIVEVSNENIKKACDTFGLNYEELFSKAEKSEALVTSEEEDKDKEEKAKKKIAKSEGVAGKTEGEVIAKGENEEDEDEEEKKKREAVEKGEGAEETEEAEDKEEKVEKAGTTIKKSLEPNDKKKKFEFQKAQTTVLLKSMGIYDLIEDIRSESSDASQRAMIFKKKVLAFDELVKGMRNELNSVKKENGELKKAIDGFEDLNKRLHIVENTPVKKSSITSHVIEKGFNSEEVTNKGLEGKTVLSLSRNKREISSLLGAKMEEEFTKGLSSGPFGTAAILFESNKIISKDVVLMLNKEGIVITI